MIKKILLLIIATIFLTGCYDYQELNDRSIIVGASIDYEDNEYIVNFEVLNSKKSNSDQNSSNKSYLVEGKDKTFSMAYSKALFSLTKDAYLAHLKTVIFSEEVAKHHLKTVIDYLTRDPNTRNVFYPVVAKNYQAKNILSKTTTQDPVVSEAIESIIDNNNYKETISTKMTFENVLELFLNENEDAYMNVITLNDNEEIKADGIALFSNYYLVDILNAKDSATAIFLNKKSKNYYISLACENDNDKKITLDLYDNYNLDFEIKERTLKIKAQLNANVLDDECNYNFKDANIYNPLAQKFSDEISKTINENINRYMDLNSDFLGIKRTYYIKERKYLNDWQRLKVTSEVELKINKNGIIFEVKQ